ncbi:hypothetical protein Q8A67_021267 [Cirrhinus molitorella]|uniref:Uncharacterized protein n=1 Tax=Cirrhinus molitorella TaxID=172907 RepID=A0AA88P9G2_9TELE|nr:hypothetical protein Q8A67_021267 [Cirrhinus molitorella]
MEAHGAGRSFSSALSARQPLTQTYISDHEYFSITELRVGPHPGLVLIAVPMEGYPKPEAIVSSSFLFLALPQEDGTLPSIPNILYLPRPRGDFASVIADSTRDRLHDLSQDSSLST